LPERIDYALNGEKALEIIKRDVELQENGDERQYELILMDCNMPFMDGYSCTKKIRKIYKDSLGISLNS